MSLGQEGESLPFVASYLLILLVEHFAVKAGTTWTGYSHVLRIAPAFFSACERLQKTPQKLHRPRGLGPRWKGGRDERCDGVKARCEGKRVELRHTSSGRREGQKESASFALQQGSGAASPATSEPPGRVGNRVAQHS